VLFFHNKSRFSASLLHPPVHLSHIAHHPIFSSLHSKRTSKFLFKTSSSPISSLSDLGTQVTHPNGNSTSFLHLSICIHCQTKSIQPAYQRTLSVPSHRLVNAYIGYEQENQLETQPFFRHESRADAQDTIAEEPREADRRMKKEKRRGVKRA